MQKVKKMTFNIECEIIQFLCLHFMSLKHYHKSTSTKAFRKTDLKYIENVLNNILDSLSMS